MKRHRILVTSLLLLVTASSAWGREVPGWKTFGIRGGLNAIPKHEYFHRYDLFARYGLPWSLRGSSGWGIATQLNVSAGALYSAGVVGFIGAVGPTVVINRGDRGFEFELSGDLDVVSPSAYGRQDFNGNLLYEGAVGVTYRFDSGYGIGYRFSHMSNGGTYNRGNPGLDLHTAVLSWNF